MYLSSKTVFPSFKAGIILSLDTNARSIAYKEFIKYGINSYKFPNYPAKYF